MIGMGWDEFKSIREENAMRGGRGLNLYYDGSVRCYDPGLEDYNSGISVPVYRGYLGFHTSWGVELRERTRIMRALTASMDEIPRIPLERTQGGIEDIRGNIRRRLTRSCSPVSYGSWHNDTVYGMRDRVLERLQPRSFGDSLF